MKIIRLYSSNKELLDTLAKLLLTKKFSVVVFWRARVFWQLLMAISLKTLFLVYMNAIFLSLFLLFKSIHH
jgi:hypothetical protein